MELSTLLEAILFYKAEPVTIKWLVSATKKSEGDVRAAMRELEETLSGRGVQLVWNGDSVQMTTAATASDAIKQITKEELEKDLGKAALETLTIILYRGPIAKGDIDYIRGVNSNFMLRGLLIRGLIEREAHPEDKRTFVYKPSMELLAYLGVSRVEELPEYETVQQELREFEEAFQAAEQKNHGASDTATE